VNQVAQGQPVEGVQAHGLRDRGLFRERSGSSVGSVVTVGLAMSPWLSDQIEAPVVCSVEQ
jgi:hypothetical protein